MNNIRLKKIFELLGQNHLTLMYFVQFVHFRNDNYLYFLFFEQKSYSLTQSKINFSKTTKDIQVLVRLKPFWVSTLEEKRFLKISFEIKVFRVEYTHTRS